MLVFQAQLLTDGGLRGQDICVLAYYSKQVHWIRHILRQKKLSQVSTLLGCDLVAGECVCVCVQVQVCRVEDVQGREFRALIISTVRTSSIESTSEKEAGFLSNPKVYMHVLVMLVT